MDQHSQLKLLLSPLLIIPNQTKTSSNALLAGDVWTMIKFAIITRYCLTQVSLFQFNSPCSPHLKYPTIWCLSLCFFFLSPFVSLVNKNCLNCQRIFIKTHKSSIFAYVKRIAGMEVTKVPLHVVRTF